MRNTIPLCLLAGAGLALSSCARTSAQASAPVSETPIVAVVKATRANLSNSLVLTAEFEPFQQIDVMSKVTGYVRQIKVDIGDRVREGQLLAILEIPEMQDDLARAAAAIQEAQADLGTARDDLERAQSSHEASHLSYSRIQTVSKREPGLVPQQDVDEARSRDLVSEAQISAAKSHIASCEQRIRIAQAEQARLKTLSAYATIRAPFTGVVTRRYANTGSLIQAGTTLQAMPVVRLSENGLLRLALPVPESVVPLIHPGEPVDVKVSALNRSFPGRVARFADTLDASTRTMKTEVDVPNPSLTLVPGMYAEVDLITAQKNNVLSVPVEAVDGSGDSARVFAVRSPGVIEVVPIHAGVETARLVEVRSGELRVGDDVVVGSRTSLKNGDKVQPKTITLAGGPTPKS